MNCRIKNQGLTILRRSGDRQETSLEKQVLWAVDAAQKQGVTLDASLEDLVWMQKKRLHKHKALRLDDAISGDELDRPGLTSMLLDACSDSRISHVFAFARDRLGRPSSPVDMMAKEMQLLQHGITIVYPDKVLDMPASGQLDIAELIKMLLDYHMSGEHPRKLAEQMINTQRLLADHGYSIGGNAPYGCVRALIDSQNNIQEYLPRGKRVRQLGCHVVWVPDPHDPKKLQNWVQMLLLKEQGFGYKRIANYQNKQGILSPAAGTTRHDHGQPHQIEGLWNHTTVKNLLENRTILAILDYGRRSEGKYRRLSAHGPRFITDADRNKAGRPKVIRNSPELMISRPLPFEPLFDPSRWDKIRAQTLGRNQSQRGIPRAVDPAKYPLSCRVVDLTDGCGAIMYGRTSGKRPLYNCGRYMKYGAAACENNQVDAEALLRFTLETLCELVDRAGSRDQLRVRLLERANAARNTPADSDLETNRAALQTRIRDLERQRQLASRNATLAEDPDLRADAETLFVRIKRELESAKQQLAALASTTTPATSPEAEVDKALALMDRIREATRDPQARTKEARAEVPAILSDLGLRLGLRFVGRTKGLKRQVRQLAGGVIALDNRPLPTMPHDHNDLSRKGGPLTVPEINTDNLRKNDDESPMLATRPDECRPEGISSTKVNRGDRI